MPSAACTVCGAITTNPNKRCDAHPPARSPSSQATGTRAHRRRRAEMLDRAGPNPICDICLEPILPGQELDAHHVDPVSTHGPDGPLAPTHANCNRSKGAR